MEEVWKTLRIGEKLLENVEVEIAYDPGFLGDGHFLDKWSFTKED